MPSNMLKRLREEFSFVRGNLLILILSYTLFRTVSSMSYSFESLYIRELGASPLLIGLMGSLGSLIIPSASPSPTSSTPSRPTGGSSSSAW